jgi:hypothetical protein
MKRYFAVLVAVISLGACSASGGGETEDVTGADPTCVPNCMTGCEGDCGDEKDTCVAPCSAESAAYDTCKETCKEAESPGECVAQACSTPQANLDTCLGGLSCNADYASCKSLCPSGCDNECGTTGTVLEEDTSGEQQFSCNFTRDCHWGEACIAKTCQIPEGYNPAKTAFEFSKIDECPGSPTHKQEIILRAGHGKVTLLYFATSTCGACVADVQVYEAMVDQMEYKGFIDAIQMITILLPLSGGALADFAKDIHSPVLLDDVETGIADAYQAGKDTVVLINKAGYPAYSWPSIEVRGQSAAVGKAMLNEKLMELAQQWP